MSPSRLLASLRTGCTLLALSLLIAGVTSATAAADEVPGLTDQERAMLDVHRVSDGTKVPVAGPAYYVAPGIRVIERQMPAPAVPLRDAKSVQRYLARTSPSNLGGILVNGGFEDGNFNGWTTQGTAGTGIASTCGANMPPEAVINIDGTLGPANNDACIRQVYQANANNVYAARLGDQTPWGTNPAAEPQCTSIRQDAVIPAGTADFHFAYAVMAQNPGHGFGQDPYFNVRVDDLTTATNLYNVTDYTTSYNPGNPCSPWCGGTPGVVYRCWTEVHLDLSALAGHTVRISLLASDCTPSGHWGSVFLDGADISCPDNQGPDAAELTASCAPDAAGTDLCATVSWTAPGDPTSVINADGQSCDPAVGAAAAYDLRWSTSPIATAADFAAATQVNGEPAPAAGGTAESMVVCGLPEGDVYFALQSSDASFNESSITTVQTTCLFNQRPDCSNAAPSIAVLWPPNHKYQAISIEGVTDPDGDDVTIVVTGITQDEPLNTRGDGNTCPDGIIESGQASVRAERTGTPGIPGNGRVYAITFTATDSHGASCTSTVTVCCPHDMGDPTCVDDGQRYDSAGDCREGNSVQTEVTAYGLTVMGVAGNEATIEFALPQDSRVQVGVFDVAGRRLASLENGTLAMGRYTRTWNMSGVANGLYYVRMNAGGTLVSKTVLKLQ